MSQSMDTPGPSPFSVEFLPGLDIPFSTRVLLIPDRHLVAVRHPEESDREQPGRSGHVPEVDLLPVISHLVVVVVGEGHADRVGRNPFASQGAVVTGGEIPC